MATPEDMERLRKAITTDGERVEIQRHIGQASGTLAAASDNARRASEANARGERVARIMDADGRSFECGVDAAQAHELIAAGAHDLG